MLFKRTILKGETSTFVMELPPYHVPTFNGIIVHTWERLKTFIRRAGKVIIIVVIVISFLNSIGIDGSFGNEDSDKSLLSSIGKSIVPIFKPMGISENNWPATVGLFTGIFAKEAVVGTLDNLYSRLDKTEETYEETFDFWGGIVESFRSIRAGFAGIGGTIGDPIGVDRVDDLDDEELQAEKQEVSLGTFSEMRDRFGSNTAAFSYLLFILIYMPCVAAIAAVYRETNIRWTIFSVVYLTALAWIVSTLFYQIGVFAMQPAISTMWIAGLLIGSGVIYRIMKMKTKNLHISS